MQKTSATAISFYLRNRCPEEWSDKKELVLDSAQNDQARKELFLEMLRDEEEDSKKKLTDEQDKNSLQS